MKSKLLSTVAAGCLIACMAAPALAQDTRYEPWQPDQAGANTDMVKELRSLIREAESARAADPRFLDDLKALANRYDLRPVQPTQPARPTVLLQDDFKDGDFTRGVVWSVYRGEYWVENAVGLRTIVRRQGAAAQPQQQQAPQQDTDDGDLATAIIGNILNRALDQDGNQGQQQTQAQQQTGDERFVGPAEIVTRAAIPNAFKARLEITSREPNGSFRFGPAQGRGATGPSYQVSYQPGAQTGFALLVASSRGERVIGRYNRSVNLEDGRLHVVELTRTTRGQMTVSLDGTPVIVVDDNSLRDPFDGFLLANQGGDYAVRKITISR